ncbi:MAG: heavy-metal-associated domain-containing protein [Desulfarculus sp.]|nr:heavy-metal-associated domain-containing protein [Desulfarculus sp.]
MESKTVNIPKISCGHCLMNIKREVSELPGVQSVEGDVATKKVTVQWEAPATWDKIAETLKDAGYPAE